MEENIVLIKLSEIEKTVKQTQRDMKEFIAMSCANSTKSEIQSMRSEVQSMRFSNMKTNDSLISLDNFLTHQGLNEPDTEQIDTPLDLSTPSTSNHRLSETINGFRVIDNNTNTSESILNDEVSVI